MKPYLSKTKRTFYNYWYGKPKNIQSSKVRNRYLKKYGKDIRIEICLPTTTSRSALKSRWKKEEL